MTSVHQSPSFIKNKEQEYQALTGMIGSGIDKITKNIASMKKMVNKLESSKDSPELIKELQMELHNTTGIIGKTVIQLKGLDTLLSTYQSIKRQEKKKQLENNFMSTMQNFEMLKDSLDLKVKEQITQVPSKEVKSHKQPYDETQHQEIEQDYPKTRLQLYEQIAAESAECKARAKIVTEMEEDIIKYNYMVQRQHKLIAEQRAYVENITHNVDQAAISVERGLRNLEAATRNRHKYLKKKIILIVLVVFFVIIGIGILLGIFVKF